MDKQKQIEEMAKIIRADYKEWLDVTGCIPQGTSYYAECLGGAIDCAELLYNAGYRKIPENAVVIPKEISYYENIEKAVVSAKIYGKTVDFTVEQILALTTIFHHKDLQENEIRKEMAEKFAERVKEETDHGISALYDSTVDEICKEFTEGKI